MSAMKRALARATEIVDKAEAEGVLLVSVNVAADERSASIAVRALHSDLAPALAVVLGLTEWRTQAMFDADIEVFSGVFDGVPVVTQHTVKRTQYTVKRVTA